MNWKNGLISGVVGGIVLNVANVLLMLVSGTSDWYSATFPGMMSFGGAVAMAASLLAIGLWMGLIYSVVRESIPGKGIQKGIRYGLMVWLLAGTMWPIMMMGFAPAYVWLIEIVDGLVGYMVTGTVVALVYEKLK